MRGTLVDGRPAHAFSVQNHTNTGNRTCWHISKPLEELLLPRQPSRQGRYNRRRRGLLLQPSARRSYSVCTPSKLLPVQLEKLTASTHTLK